MRNAYPHETGLLAEIGYAAWLAAVASWGESTAALAPAVRQSYERFCHEHRSLILVGETNVAVAGWGARENRRNEISDLWVDPDHQGQGVGSAVLAALEAEIVGLGYETAELHTHARNIPAIELYKRRGYRISSLSDRYSPSLDRDVATVFMTKELADVR
ncbi:GNAT family N-acetyltransferase [Pararhizobium mangrovi]|uniref:GNAT family N-acetyltransferase n=1 Tax=Pararhizobium mangrovi TaxID=2590452 RepID=UPI001F33675A|nr:GNAT family N-acetyltransferase [Pararhizobium mangrovi]